MRFCKKGMASLLVRVGWSCAFYTLVGFEGGDYVF